MKLTSKGRKGRRERALARLQRELKGLNKALDKKRVGYDSLRGDAQNARTEDIERLRDKIAEKKTVIENTQRNLDK